MPNKRLLKDSAGRNANGRDDGKSDAIVYCGFCFRPIVNPAIPAIKLRAVPMRTPSMPLSIATTAIISMATMARLALVNRGWFNIVTSPFSFLRAGYLGIVSKG